MVAVPAFVWRGGFVQRALAIGGVVGLCLGGLAWLDSGFLLSGVLVLIVVGGFFGIWMPRRMARYWPGAEDLTGSERMTVVRAVRRGERIADARLAQPVLDYSRALHAAADNARPLRWLLVFVLVVAIGTAVWDALSGSWGSTAASAIYLVALVLELFWWPKWLESLLANADRAATIAQHVSEEHGAAAEDI